MMSGMVPGSALSLYAKKDSLDKPEVSRKMLRWLVHDFQDQVLWLAVVGVTIAVHQHPSLLLHCG